MSDSRGKDVRFAYLIEPPFCFRAPDNTVTGCDVDLARHVLGALGIPSFIPVETQFADLVQGLADGRWGMTTGMFVTDERRKHAAFSRPIWALPDGLLVTAGNPLAISGYASIAKGRAVLSVIKDQVQHETALHLGVPEERIRLFDTYAEAAGAVRQGTVDAYASVARAHRGYLERSPDAPFAVVDVPTREKPPEFGAFAFASANGGLRDAVDAELMTYLGSPGHRRMMARFGFTQAEVDLVAG